MVKYYDSTEITPENKTGFFKKLRQKGKIDKQKKSTIIYVVIGLLILVLIAVGIYFFVQYRDRGLITEDQEYQEDEMIYTDLDKEYGMNSVPIDSNLWLDEHNRIRADVGQDPVTWNKEMADSASKFVNKCEFKHSVHSDRMLDGNILGENLGYGGPFDQFGEKQMIQAWENEKKNYEHPDIPRHGKDQTGHYTQMVNKKLKEIGCGCAKCGGNRLCICRYNPIQLADEPPY